MLGRAGRHLDVVDELESAKDGTQAKALETQRRRNAFAALAGLVVVAWLGWTWYHILRIQEHRAAPEEALEEVPSDTAVEEYFVTEPRAAEALLNLDKLTNLPGYKISDRMKKFVVHPELPPDGRGGNAAREFQMDFLSLELAKTRTKHSKTKLTNAGGCSHRGPRGPAAVSPNGAKVEHAVLASLGESLAERVSAHVSRTKGARLLSPQQHDLCSWDPTIFLPSLPSFSRVRQNDLDAESDHTTSAYLFHDVCVTWNIDSSKQAQRALVIVDPTNNSKLRCTPCPNPQTNYEWGTNRCGMMWTHQSNVKSLAEYQTCYDAARRNLAASGQRQIPGDRGFGGHDHALRAVVYYDRPSLLLQYTKNNPGHQLWDSLFSLLPLLKSQDVHRIKYFDLVAAHQAPQCSDEIWICNILRKIGALGEPGLGPARTDRGPELIDTFPGVLTCFSELIVPVQGWNHVNEHSTRDLLDWLRDKVSAAYGLRKHIMNAAEAIAMTSALAGSGAGRGGAAPNLSYRALLYAHDTVGEAGRRRAWVDVKDFMAEALTKAPELDVKFIPDFAKVGVEAQANAFHEADLVLMPHGGQFGNVIFMRRNAVAVELTCGGYSHLATGEGAMARNLQIYHIVERPCDCDARNDKGNFRYSIDSLRRLMKWVEANVAAHQYGTYRVNSLCP